MTSCYKSICKAIKSKGVSCDEVDIDALSDSSLSCTENLKNVLSELGLTKRKSYDDYAGMYKSMYKKKMCKSVKVKSHTRKCPKR